MLRLKNCTKDDFFELAKRKRVFAFGTGQQPHNFNNRNPNYPLGTVVDFFCDNDSKKWGKVFEINNREVPIISPQEMYNCITRNDIIIITTRSFNEVVDVLDHINQLNDIDCYILTCVEKLRNKITDKEIKKIYNSMSREIQIPKIIHYCWFGDNAIPEKEKYCIDSWREQCPDYEIICWNEKNYDISKNKYMRQAYESQKWGFVVDFARLDIIQSYGGVYLDADVELLRPIDELLKFNAFAGYESEKYVAFGLGFGAIKNHPVIKANKQVYENVDFFNEDGLLNLTASPSYQTDCLCKLGFKPDGHFQMIDGMAILPPEFLCGMNVSTRMLELTPNTYAIHHYSASWMPEEDKNWNKNTGEWIARRLAQRTL